MYIGVVRTAKASQTCVGQTGLLWSVWLFLELLPVEDRKEREVVIENRPALLPKLFVKVSPIGRAIRRGEFVSLFF